jgi:transcriptional regulator NrdR family protein
MSDGLLCPRCSAVRNYVKDSRPNHFGVRRRRVCMTCKYRWTTYEVPAEECDDVFKMNELAERIDALDERDRQILWQLVSQMERI